MFKIKTESILFKIHCAFTSDFLIIFALLIFFAQWNFESIKCIASEKSQEYVDSICWDSPTPTMIEALQLGYREYEHTHVNKNIFRQQQEYRTHRLVGWILILQALMCYFPKYLWTACEKKLTKFILKGLNNELLGQDMDESLYYSLKKYLNPNNIYIFTYLACEGFCFLNIIFQLRIMDYNFGRDYGLNAMLHARYDNIEITFPPLINCTFIKIGPLVGQFGIENTTCYLPLNFMKEVIHTFVWFWFAILLIIYGLAIQVWLMLLVSTRMRQTYFHLRNPIISQHVVECLSRKLPFGDHWFLYKLDQYLDPITHRNVIALFAKKVNFAIPNYGE